MRQTCPARRTARLASSPSASAAAPRRRGRDHHLVLWLRDPAEVWRLAGVPVHRMANRFRHGTPYPDLSGAGDLRLQTDTRSLGRHGRRKRYQRAIRISLRLARGSDLVAGCPGAAGSCTKGGSSRTGRSNTERVPARERVPRMVLLLVPCRPTSCTCPACAVVGLRGAMGQLRRKCRISQGMLDGREWCCLAGSIASWRKSRQYPGDGEHPSVQARSSAVGAEAC